VIDGRAPSVVPALDPGFRPLYSALRDHARALEHEPCAASLTLALERVGGVSRFTLPIFGEQQPRAAESARLVERVLKVLLWQRGAHRVYVAGSSSLAADLAARYRPGGERGFDAEFFAKIYERPFEVLAVDASELPPEQEQASAVGGHFDGCRIGFDAGGSDRKVAALIDGKQVFASETPWQPKQASDPEYHVRGIDDSIRQAAAHLPRIDAIGVSSAGIYLENRTLVASLFRSVPEPAFSARIKRIYPDIASKWGGVPLEVRNDGDVTALAGSLALGRHALLGIAMGTSQAAGYVDRGGLLTGWLNELAFAPVAIEREAPIDREWSGDRGTGVNYFSQDAALRLAQVAGVPLDESALPAEQLEQLQRAVLHDDARARSVFDSLGVYLGYGLLLYAELYELEHVLLLGRVTSGRAGSILLERTRAVLERESPELAERLSLHLPDEATRRVGQAVAAASLPRLGGEYDARFQPT
jgi:predicted NBD/HSP70 family sugar kinase